MDGAFVNHNRIVNNITIRLSDQISKTGCEVFAFDLRLWIADHRVFTYPDILIIYDKPQFYSDRNDTITNPLVIFEVLSESTRSYNRGKKFYFYQSILTFREYVLVEQNSIHVEHFHIIPGNKWQLIEYNDVKEQFQLKAVEVLLKVQGIYRNVDFKP